MDQAALERELFEVGRRLADALPSTRNPLKVMDDKAMDLASSDAELKAALFRFVDVVPACRNLDDLARHLTGFLEEIDAKPPPIGVAMRMGNTRAGRRALGIAAAAGVRHMAQRFIVGESPKAALGDLKGLWKDGVASSVDLLGEATVTQAEAQRYADRCAEALDTIAGAAAGWPARAQLERDSAGPLPRANLSVKVSALTPLLRPDAPGRGKRDAADRLRPLLRRAHERGAHLHIDMESMDSRDAVLELILELLAEAEFRAGPSAGLVVQGYLRDSPDTLDTILAWLEGAGAGRAHPLTIRLVKGAYWDHELVQAAQHGWSTPVFERKADTDANFEGLTRRLLDARPLIRPAIASHNLRSVAHAIAYNRLTGGEDGDLELQVLRGLGDPLQAAIAAQGLRVRTYCPVGDLVAGMAYLVRRLLENTSNESFLYEQGARHAARGAPGGPGMKPFANEAILELRRAPVRAQLAGALEAFDAEPPVRVPVWVGEDARTGDALISTDPGEPDRVVAEAAVASEADVDAALAAADGEREWRRTPAAQRAEVLIRAAAWLRERRLAIAALEVRETAKPWREADGDVCEAIDFLEYYARAAVALEEHPAGVPGSPGERLIQLPGERNELRWAPRGVVAVISPWNFPVAIPLGMVAAGLATGNAVLLKPAEQAPACGYMAIRALREAGVPPAALALLPGEGAVGAQLVCDRRVHTIAFTGSGPVGLEIVRRAAELAPGQNHLKRVVAEMGGKNCVIVDSDADLDDVVPALVKSAFNYSGQKCSAAARVLAHEAIHDALVERLAGAVEVLHVGQAADPEIDLGPVIEEEAQERVARYAADAEAHGRIAARAASVPTRGWFATPTLAADLPEDSPVLREEIFGPLLAVERVKDMEAACDRVDASPFALTGGLFSRSPRTVDYVSERTPVGNLYVNREITGAMVGRQPFGGNRLSGTGTKAGGPGYLLQFVEPRVVTENTVRHGLVV